MWSELHAAAYNVDVDEVTKLLAAGVSPDTRDDRGHTPLLWACFRAAVGDQVPIIRALTVAGADPNVVIGDSNCLIYAIHAGQEAAVRVLIAAGADVDGAADGVTPLMVAAQQGDVRIVDLLLRSGADASIRCGSFTASDYARSREHNKLADRIDGLSG